MPALPEGEYRVFCDMTFKDGLSSTGTTSARLPAIPGASAGPASMVADPDDSWTISPAASVPAATTGDAVYHLPQGLQVVWKAHPALRVKQDAALRFEVRDSAGHPVDLEPYMGMISHTAILRADGGVFAHLHPSGNYSMAAQGFFASKMSIEAGGTSAGAGGMDGMAGMAGMDHSDSGTSSFSIPYEFPSAGNYRIWVQFKIGGQILTAVFDASVAA